VLRMVSLDCILCSRYLQWTAADWRRIFILVALSTLGGMDLVLANRVKVMIVLCLTMSALLVFIADGKVA